jgi:putative hydrolase of the HAD superfamily
MTQLEGHAARDDRVLVFDLGGVVVESTGLTALGRLLPQMHPVDIQARWLASQAVGQFERGAIAADEFARAFVAEWRLGLEPAEFLRQFASWVKGFYPGADRLLRHLRERHTIACLSNTNAAHWARLDEVRQAFDVCVASHLTGCMKPDAEAYAQVLQRLGVPAHHVYYFDDLPTNVAAARHLGMHAFQVRGLAQTEQALRSLGISIRGAA